MSKQTEAQRLADWIDDHEPNFYGESSLRFDSELSDNVASACDLLRQQDAALLRQEALIAELAGALEGLATGLPDQWANVRKARAALAKVKQ